MSRLPACDVCGVEYVEGYEGCCQEYDARLGDEEIAHAIAEGRKPRSCPGYVNLIETLERHILKLERNYLK